MSEERRARGMMLMGRRVETSEDRGPRKGIGIGIGTNAKRYNYTMPPPELLKEDEEQVESEGGPDDPVAADMETETFTIFQIQPTN